MELLAYSAGTIKDAARTPMKENGENAYRGKGLVNRKDEDEDENFDTVHINTAELFKHPIHSRSLGCKGMTGVH